MHIMGEERDMFAGLGWEKGIRSLGDPHVPFNSSPEPDRVMIDIVMTTS